MGQKSLAHRDPLLPLCAFTIKFPPANTTLEVIKMLASYYISQNALGLVLHWHHSIVSTIQTYRWLTTQYFKNPCLLSPGDRAISVRSDFFILPHFRIAVINPDFPPLTSKKLVRLCAHFSKISRRFHTSQ